MFRNLFLSWLLLFVPGLCEDAPKVFQRLDFATASSLAKEQGRWLLVDATAVWCPPCHRMDATTWIAPELEAYAQKNLVAIQVDVDQEAELADRLGISSMPTVIVFGPDGELGRLVGYKTSQELLAWLSDLREEKTWTDSLREKAP